MKLSKILISSALVFGIGVPIIANQSKAKETSIARADAPKDLKNIISYNTCSFAFTNISNFLFSFSLSEQIFTNTSYMNDHLTDGTFKDENNNNINLGEGIEINGKTLQYWVDYTPIDSFSYPRNSGVTVFPLYADKKFNPIAIEAKANKIEFKVDLNTIAMDDITVTFKAGLFKGYNANTGTIYTLSEDLTYYSVISQSGSPARVTFVQQKNWEPIRNAYRSLVDWNEKTASMGGKYHQYLMWTDIPFDKEVIKHACPADNYRYMYGNLLMNGKSIAYYNSWARGNSKDFTDLSDVSTLNPDYEVGHPLGNTFNTTYDLAIRIEIVRDQPTYAFVFSVPNQLVTDLSLGTLSFSIREGACFFTKDASGNLMIGRVSTTEFNNLVLAANQEIENYVDLGDYRESEQNQILDIIADAQSEIENAVSKSEMDVIIAEAKANIDLLDSIPAMEQRHIDAVVTLIDAIPSTITYTEECGSAINAAMEGFATLTASEVTKFPSTKLDLLYTAHSSFEALDLANYKTLSKAEILTVQLNLYRELQKSAITDLQSIANAAIDSATGKTDVQTIVDNFFAAVALLPTDAQLSKQELDTAKAEAKTQLDEVDLSKYRESEKAKVIEIIANGKVAIDQCQSVNEIETLLNKIFRVIGDVKTADQIASAKKAAAQKTTIITSFTAGSILLITGISLAIFFLRKFKLSK